MWTSLHKLIDKELVVEEVSGNVYEWNPHKDMEKLESVHSDTLDELYNRN